MVKTIRRHSAAVLAKSVYDFEVAMRLIVFSP
jgi:hypothetical protein